MRKLLAFSIIALFAITLLSSCRSHAKCEAYTKVETKAKNTNF